MWILPHPLTTWIDRDIMKKCETPPLHSICFYYYFLILCHSYWMYGYSLIGSINSLVVSTFHFHHTGHSVTPRKRVKKVSLLWLSLATPKRQLSKCYHGPELRFGIAQWWTSDTVIFCISSLQRRQKIMFNLRKTICIAP